MFTLGTVCAGFRLAISAQDGNADWIDVWGSSPTDAAVTFVDGRGDCWKITSAEDCHDGWKRDGSCPVYYYYYYYYYYLLQLSCHSVVLTLVQIKPNKNKYT